MTYTDSDCSCCHKGFNHEDWEQHATPCQTCNSNGHPTCLHDLNT